jgi:3-dehydroquinate synthase
LEDNTSALKQADQAALTYAIERSCLNKAKVVSADETEQGIRAILNLGHTFGHAIETFQNYSGWLHGEAVAAGMVMASELSMMMGGLSQSEFDRIKNLIKSWSLPVAPPQDMTAEDFNLLMYRDKKVLDGELRLVLLRTLGDAEVTSEYSAQSLQTVLSSNFS